MATSTFFNNWAASNEQNLYEDLIVESIRIYGHDVYYVPRTLGALDPLYGESRTASFEEAHLVEVYVKSVDGFTGDGQFFSKFGLEIRDQVVLTIARKAFADEVGSRANLVRPREGDLIYLPFNRKAFQIRFVDDKPFFYQLGTLMTYDLTCELFEYSHETFATGIPEIDAIQTRLDRSAESHLVQTSEGDRLVDESGQDLIVGERWESTSSDPLADNATIQRESDAIIDFSETDPFSENGRW